MKKIKILLFDHIELLDFAGPLEVFSVAQYIRKELNLEVSTIAFQPEITVAKSLLKVRPSEIFDPDSIDAADLFLIPGGIGTRALIQNQHLLQQIEQQIKASTVVASVCTGALILAQLGHLKGLPATTHKGGISELLRIEPSVRLASEQRFIDNGHILTSAGISAGIDMSLHLVEKYFGLQTRAEVQQYMEYQP